MILYIDTTHGDDIIIAIKNGHKVVARKKFQTKRNQAEKLLPAIDKLLGTAKIKLSALSLPPAGKFMVTKKRLCAVKTRLG